MKNFKAFFACFCISLFLVSCIENAGNYQIHPYTNAVVFYSPEYTGLTFMCTSSAGIVAASELDSKDYHEGDCFLATFTTDFDHQPEPNKYLMATQITEKRINQTYINLDMMYAGSDKGRDYVIDSLSVDSIQSVRLVGYYPCIGSKLFMEVGQKESETLQNYEYQLVYSDSLINKVPVLYVCAKKSGNSSATPMGDYKYQAVDISGFLDKYMDSSDKKFSFYLLYKKGVNKEKKNVYQSISSSAFTSYNLSYR